MSMRLEDVLIKPLLSEKISEQTEKNNCYGFQVNMQANKYQIKSAVEKFFDVKVEKVATAIMPGKVKRTGRHVKKTTKTKKAYVQVEQGQKIEFFKGV